MKKNKELDEQVAALMMKHSRFIESKRKRPGWTAERIVAEVLKREEKK